MNISLIINGIIIGILVSAPLGPIGVLCIKNTMYKGFRAGLITGLGAVIADVIFAGVAGFSVTLIENFLATNQFAIRIIGGIILAVLGIKIFMSNPANQVREIRTKGKRYFKDFVTTFIVAITNPITVIAFGTFFASFHVLEGATTNLNVIVLIFSVLIGALIWWLSLVTIIWLFRKRMKLRNLLVINKVTGVLVVIFALFIAFSVFFLNK